MFYFEKWLFDYLPILNWILVLSCWSSLYTLCKVMPNEDHATCGKERFIATRPQGCHYQVQSEVARLKWEVGFIGGAKPWGRERVSGLQLSTITRWNRSTSLASWVAGSSWVVLQAEKQSGRETSSHKLGGLVSALTLGPSTCPKNARDLTLWLAVLC
jgi:hypothetical protein